MSVSFILRKMFKAFIIIYGYVKEDLTCLISNVIIEEMFIYQSNH